MNKRTFYRYDTGAPRSISAVYLPMLLISILASLINGAASDNFLNGVIATQAILIGFAFTVIFQIGSVSKKFGDVSDSIENKLESDRINKLTSEIFYNIAYFILTALICVVFALTLLLHNDQATAFFAQSVYLTTIFLQKAYPAYIPTLDETLALAKVIIKIIIPAAFYFLIEDSLFTFARAVGRVIFLFERRRA